MYVKRMYTNVLKTTILVLLFTVSSKAEANTGIINCVESTAS